jgi:hypothetical protein
MVIWTVGQSETSEEPTFSLTGVMVSWADGAPAVLKQTPFRWHDEAWQACVEVSRPGRDTFYSYGTIRLEAAVAAAWRHRRVNPRREAATQLRSAMNTDPSRTDLGVVTFRAV